MCKAIIVMSLKFKIGAGKMCNNNKVKVGGRKKGKKEERKKEREEGRKKEREKEKAKKEVHIQ